MSFERFKYQNDYNREHYARLSVNIDINKRPAIDEHWKALGYKSFTNYVVSLIEKDMNDTKNIVVGDITQKGDNNSINIG